MGIVPLSTRRGLSTPILEPAHWQMARGGWVWREDRIDNRGRIVLKRCDNRHAEIRLYRPADDPGTGASILGAPYWIRVARPSDYPETTIERNLHA